MNIDDYAPWQGREERLTERLDGWPVRGLRALLDQPPEAPEGAAAPALAQWLWFAPMVPQSAIDTDGHPKRGGFLPPVALPRRMWAGSDITLHHPLRIGATVTKTMTVADIALKDGSTGPLVFVQVRNRYAEGDTPLMDETQILVYRDRPAPDAAAPAPRAAPTGADWSQAVPATAALLFRYSAVTFNAHRIHYDADYTRADEGYPAILLQGQLGATLMMEALLAQTGGTRPRQFSFRGVQPIHVDETVWIEGKARPGGWDLWLRDGAGVLRMSAKAEA
jgi:3-methylfumaryl-CoA hydratase